MSDQLIVDALTSLIARHFEMDPGQLKPDSNLQALGLDSIAMAELLVVIEGETGVNIPLTDERMPVGADVTVATMADYVALFTDESNRPALLALGVEPAADADA